MPGCRCPWGQVAYKSGQLFLRTPGPESWVGCRPGCGCGSLAGAGRQSGCVVHGGWEAGGASGLYKLIPSTQEALLCAEVPPRAGPGQAVGEGGGEAGGVQCSRPGPQMTKITVLDMGAMSACHRGNFPYTAWSGHWKRLVGYTRQGTVRPRKGRAEPWGHRAD